MSKAVVVCPGYAEHGPERHAVGNFGLSLELLDWKGDRDRLTKGLKDAQLIFVRDTKLDAEILGHCEQARGIVRYGVGVDTIDLKTATARRIMVANIPDYGAEIEVADHTLALYLAVQRSIVNRDKAIRNGTWGMEQAQPIQRIAGRTLGLVGYGRIARAVHRRFASFGIDRVLAVDPFVNDEALRAAGVERVELLELAARADIVSIHAPAQGERSLIDADFISRMRSTSVLINTSRGSQVDEAALFDALNAGTIWGAGLDVLACEPPRSDHPFFGLSNVVLTDHAGWYSEATVSALQNAAAAEATRMLSGGRPENWVNPW